MKQRYVFLFLKYIEIIHLKRYRCFDIAKDIMMLIMK